MSGPRPGPGVAVRVLSYNVRSLRDDADAVAAVIRAVRPDVVCIQEAPRFLRWRSRCAELARRSGLVVAGGGRPAAANLILVALRAQVQHSSDVLLPKRAGLHQRGVALAVVRIGGARLAVAGTHLSLDGAERAAQAAGVEARLAALDAQHSVLCADVNEAPGGPAWTALAASLRDAHAAAPAGGSDTFPAAAPDRRIDAVFVSAAVEVRGCGVPDAGSPWPAGGAQFAPASDHRPVLADLILPALRR